MKYSVATTVLALGGLACEGDVTKPPTLASADVTFDLRAALESAAPGDPVPTRAVLFWEHGGDTTAAEPVELTDGLGRFSVTVPKGKVQFWAGAESRAGTALFWTQNSVSEDVRSDGFEVPLPLASILPEPNVSPLNRPEGSPVGIFELSPRSVVDLHVRNDRNPADVLAARAAGRSVDLSWEMIPEGAVKISPAPFTVRTLAPGETVPVDIRGVAASGVAVSAKVTFRFWFGAASDSLSSEVVLLLGPDIDIEKSTNGADADRFAITIPTGAPVNWRYVVKNSGYVDLTNIRVTDAVLTGGPQVQLNCPFTTTDRLAPGDSFVCTASDTASAGPYANEGGVTAQSIFGTQVSDADTSRYLGLGTPGGTSPLEVNVTTNGYDADVAPGPDIKVGDPVTWAYAVTIVGSDTVRNVTISDSRIDLSGVCPLIPELLPADTVTCSAHGIAVAEQYSNEARATGTTTTGCCTIMDVDSSHYFGQGPVVPSDPDSAALRIEKSTRGVNDTIWDDADDTPGVVVQFEDSIFWQYVVTNVGTVSLANVAVTDSDTTLQVQCPPPPISLAPGASVTCTASDFARKEGQYKNIGTATGTDPDGNQVTAADPSHYFARKIGG